MGRWKKLTLKNLIFGNFWGPEVDGSSLYQKNIGAELTLFIGLHCVDRSLWSATTLATLMAIPGMYFVNLRHVLDVTTYVVCNSHAVAISIWTICFYVSSMQLYTLCM